MILATCATCGDVDLRPEDVTLEVCVGSVLFHFRFVCPACGCRSVRSCDAQAAALLAANGCTTVTWSAEALEQRPQAVGALTAAEVADYVRRLRDDTALARALERLGA